MPTSQTDSSQVCVINMSPNVPPAAAGPPPSFPASLSLVCSHLLVWLEPLRSRVLTMAYRSRSSTANQLLPLLNQVPPMTRTRIQP